MSLRDLAPAADVSVARSYPEEVVLAADREAVSWEPQVLDETWQADVARGDGSCKAIFLRDVSFTDRLLYAEHKRRRMPRPRYVTRASKVFSPKLPDGVEIDTDIPQGMYMHREFIRFHSTKIETTADGASVEEIRAAMQVKAKRCLKYLDEASVDRLVEYFRSIMIKPGVQGLAWSDGEVAEWGAFAEVTREGEAQVVEILRAAGAELVDNQFEVQEYPSVHVIKPGKRWLVKRGAMELSYVPHGAVGERTVEKWVHRVAVDLPSIERMRELSLDASARRVFKLEDLLLVRSSWKDEHDQVHIDRHVEVARWMRSKRRRVLEAGEEWKRRDEHGRHVRDTATAVDADAMAQHGHDWVDLGDGCWMRKKNYIEFKSRLDAYEGMLTTGERLELMWNSDGDERPEELSVRALGTWRSSFDEAHRAAIDDMLDGTNTHRYPRTKESLVAADIEWRNLLRALDRTIKHYGIPRVLKRLVLDGDVLRDDVQHSASWEARQEPILHDAPFSERGQLRVWGAEPADAVRLLQELGLAGDLEPELPIDLLWPSRTRVGRLRPVHPEYLGARRLELPEGYMVLHGMTGASDAKSALERLGSMVATGGLKCISERRRAGVGVVSMSPRGDIASGIDGGVPCKIGRAPHYGSLVIFGMRPEVLHRRELFFSPCDYGGGKDRYSSFTKYAESIGQRRIWMPPNHESRQYHLSHGLSHDDNEVYIRHEIIWEEIDTVWVEASLFDTVKERWEEWIATGLLPIDVRLERYTISKGDLPQLIAARSSALVE